MDGFKEYGCVRVELVKGGAVAGVARHHVRDYDEEHPAPAHIDPALSKNNIYLDAAGTRVKALATTDLTGRIQMAKAEHKRTTGRKVRSDANLAIDMVCYKSDLGPKKEKRFNNRKWLNDSLAWSRKEFGENNVLGAALHMDEPDRATGKVHPHIHIIMKPGVQTEKGMKLRASDMLPLGRYSELQDSYALEVGAEHGLQRGKKRARGQGPRHVSTHEFQERSARKEKKMIERADEIQDPEELREALKKLAHDVAPGLVSQEIMRERIAEEHGDEILKETASARDLANRYLSEIADANKKERENRMVIDGMRERAEAAEKKAAEAAEETKALKEQTAPYIESLKTELANREEIIENQDQTVLNLGFAVIQTTNQHDATYLYETSRPGPSSHPNHRIPIRAVQLAAAYRSPIDGSRIPIPAENLTQESFKQSRSKGREGHGY